MLPIVRAQASSLAGDLTAEQAGEADDGGVRGRPVVGASPFRRRFIGRARDRHRDRGSRPSPRTHASQRIER